MVKQRIKPMQEEPLTASEMIEKLVGLGFRDAENKTMDEEEKILRGIFYLLSLLDPKCEKLLPVFTCPEHRQRVLFCLAELHQRLMPHHNMKHDFWPGDMKSVFTHRNAFEEMCKKATGRFSPKLRATIHDFLNFDCKLIPKTTSVIQCRIATAIQNEEQTVYGVTKERCLDPSIVTYGCLSWKQVFTYYWDFHRNGGIDYKMIFDLKSDNVAYKVRLPDAETMENLKLSEEKFNKTASHQEKLALDKFVKMFNDSKVQVLLDAFDGIALQNSIACGASLPKGRIVQTFFDLYARSKCHNADDVEHDVFNKINFMLVRGWILAVCLENDEKDTPHSIEHYRNHLEALKNAVLRNPLEWVFPKITTVPCPFLKETREIMDLFREAVHDATKISASDTTFYRYLANDLVTYWDRLFAVNDIFYKAHEENTARMANWEKQGEKLETSEDISKMILLWNVETEINYVGDKLAVFEEKSPSFAQHENEKEKTTDWFDKCAERIPKPQLLPLNDFDCSRPCTSTGLFDLKPPATSS